tara:strand:+ start:363 stop:551 length:189 start_codon:yes stop_codon:yes gene_type:complete
MPSNTAAKFHVKGVVPKTTQTAEGSSKRNIQRKRSGSGSENKKGGGGGKGEWDDKVEGVDTK